jgi:acetyl esterase
LQIESWQLQNEPMPLHPQAERFLAQLREQRQPPLETQPVERSRNALLLTSGLFKDCPAVARFEDRAIAGPGGPLRVRLYWPKGDGPFGACLYFHGGGWVLNSVDTHDDLCRRLCDASGCVIVSVDYRLAPEHRYPAAIDDGYAALEWVAAHAAEVGIDPARIAVSGDSAGGNIAAVLCLMSRDRRGPPIRFQALVYPIVDCDLNRQSCLENAEGYFLTRSQMIWFWDQYLPDVPRRAEPYASPLRAASHAGLPPAYILTAEFDPLRDEGEAYAETLRRAGVAVTLHRYDGLIHAFMRRVEIFDAAKQAIAEMGQALRTALTVACA